MIEYGVPVAFLAFILIGLPVGFLVLVFVVARGFTGWVIRRAVRTAVRIGAEERERINTYR